MDAITAIETRRSVKSFDPTYQMSEAEIERLLYLARLSPTAFNIQHWRFVVVREPALRTEIRALAWMQPQITEASLLVVICADLQAWQKQPQRYWRNTTADVQQGVLAAIESHYRDNLQLQRDEGMRSCGIAAQTLMLAAKAMGYDSCPMDLADLSGVAQLIQMPPDHAIAMFVAIGKGVREPWPRAGQLEAREVIFVDHF